ncbi:ATP-binding protein [Paenibacillus polymyxa]|uniref:ATP-binding protein n=1 Tax=Paenibacillus polymyxa TaxID=1406 RepID=UPI00298CE5B8|nr:ATP-binding protein [Paenibacillus polymyxa]
MQKRIEMMRTKMKNSSSENLDTAQLKTQKNSTEWSATSNKDGCPKCDYTGTINTFRWVEDDSYTDKNGKPIPREIATVELCSCFYERQFNNYNPTDGFSPKERTYLFMTATMDDYNRTQFYKAVDFVRNIEVHMQAGTWLYIFGDDERATEVQKKAGYEVSAYGTGKTYMMQCIANALAHRKIPGLYVTEEKLFSDIKSTYNRDSDESEEEVLQRYYRVPILMIDDIFTAPYKDWAEGKLFSILEERQNHSKVTIMTSNYATGRIRQRLPINGAKIASRINGQAELIEMIGPDRRPQRKIESA